MLRAGWAEVLELDSAFQRLVVYDEAEFDAPFNRGVWKLCDGDFHLTRKDQLRQSAVEFMKRYYRRVSKRQFATAWGMLTRRVRRSSVPSVAGGLDTVVL